MATVTPSSVSNAVGSGDGTVKQIVWTLTTANADGAPFDFCEHADVTWVARGTWGGATLKFQGSDDGTNFVTAAGLNSAAGGAEASAAADKIITTLERPRYIRPILTAVGAGASIVVTALARRASSIRV
jgi:hypothetical protein